MKMKFFLTALSALVLSANAHAAVKVYDCQLKKGSGKASLVVYSDDGATVKRITWMPDEGLETTKANSDQPASGANGTIEFTLFGFQDQADVLALPGDAASLPKTMNVFTYTDDDDHAIDRQDFSCHSNS
jgi:hypothetical protein